MRVILILGIAVPLSLCHTDVRIGENHKREATGDPHNEQFCVDISFYSPVQWEEEYSEECSTPFVKKCEPKQENVCQEVKETMCEVVPYTKCTMSNKPVEYVETELTPVEFVAQECKTTKDKIPHQKMVPECRDVTKQNCVTLWETDADGKQVWAGNEKCEPVTWKECKLVPKYVDFIIPKVECEPQEPIWYHVPKPMNKVKETNIMTCEVKNTTNCVTHTREACAWIKYQECKEIPEPSCQPAHVHKPTQERVHRKKCLLPDDPAPPTYRPPSQAYGPPPASYNRGG